tara:strand:+ start:61 stop:447 length:387 start_codon:yes stop_codon:yes gene_type:complete
MINGIKPNIKSSTLNEVDKTKLGITYNEALDRLLVAIQEDYDKWGSKSGISKTLDLKVKNGRKFTKIIEGNRVWGFISRVDGVHKGAPIKVGDIMKAAGWAAAAKHSRGSIFDKEFHKSFSWTGPNYL